MERDTIVAFEDYTRHLSAASRHRQFAQWEDAFRELKCAEAFVDRCRQKVLWELGALERRYGRFENAKKKLEEAEAITRVDELQRIHILGELAIVYQHLKPVEVHNALRVCHAQYEDAKELARKEWQMFYSNGLLEHERRALEAEAQACRAIGNLGLLNYLRYLKHADRVLLQQAALQCEERVVRAQKLQVALQKESQHNKEKGNPHSSWAGLIDQARCWESIGYDRLTLIHAASGELQQALMCGEKSQELTRQSKDSTVRGLSRFFYGYALLQNKMNDKSLERLSFRSSPPDMCTCVIALCKEPLDVYAGYLEEITELGLNMEHYDEHGYSALDYAVFNNSSDMEAVVLKRLEEGNYEEAEKNHVKRAETVKRLRRESLAKKDYREVFQECLRPNLMNGGADPIQKVRNSYAKLLKEDEAKGEKFDELRVVSYSDFIEHGRLPRFTDKITRVYSGISLVKSATEPNDCVIFFSYRWKNGAEGPDDDEGTQYSRMCDALDLFLDDSCKGDQNKRKEHSESLYIWLDFACIDQDHAEPGINALPIIATQCDVMITLNEAGFFDRGWCAVEAALFQTLTQSYKKHKWYEHIPETAHVASSLQEFSHRIDNDTSKLEVSCTKDKPTIEFLLRQSKFLGN
ncbi:hypothetical protein BJ170DRAFT_676421 [Xylariales sp. AK1849]|nr:hypothetical protein BJ170DRAFT_676421 [Xylariales sp. AK1849]